MGNLILITLKQSKLFLKFFFFPKRKYSALPSEGVLLNFFGLSILTYGSLVTYLVTKYEYIRPSENQ